METKFELCAFLAVLTLCLLLPCDARKHKRTPVEAGTTVRVQDADRRRRHRPSIDSTPNLMSAQMSAILNEIQRHPTAGASSSVGGHSFALATTAVHQQSQVQNWTEAELRIKCFSPRCNGKSPTVARLSGKYGYHSAQGRVRGRVVHVRDPPGSVHEAATRKRGAPTHLGCATTIANRREIPKSGKWIALIERGHCLFFHKIKLAERMNASAVIIYNNVDKRVPVMNTVGTNIVSLMISKREGEQLVRLLENRGPKIHAVISVPRRRPTPHQAPDDQSTPGPAASAKLTGAAGSRARACGFAFAVSLLALLFTS